jgi:transposase InsO family protein
VTFAFVEAEKAAFPIRLLCRTLAVTPSGFYAWRRRPVCPPRLTADLTLRRHLRVVHAASRGVYGSPRLLRALRLGGHHVGRNRIIRLMRLEQLRGRPRRRFRLTTTADAHAAPAPNHLRQDFTVAVPNRVWVADITAVPTHEGWLYLAILLDLCSRRIVGWAVRTTLEADVVCAALQLALGRRRLDAAVLHHSDRGAQYTSDRYQALLRAHRFHCSMSRAGNCYDNAPAESFFRSLKVELGPTGALTRRAAATAVGDYIERFYNRERLHSSLYYRSPPTFEADFAVGV